MDIKQVADGMDALGTLVRLEIYRMLVRTGSEGMTIGRIQQRTGIPRSTLSHHLHRLINARLVLSEKSGTSLICRADYHAMNELLDFLSEECCADERSEDVA